MVLSLNEVQVSLGKESLGNIKWHYVLVCNEKWMLVLLLHMPEIFHFKSFRPIVWSLISLFSFFNIYNTLFNAVQKVRIL